jgi:hypothetical protein
LDLNLSGFPRDLAQPITRDKAVKSYPRNQQNSPAKRPGILFCEVLEGISAEKNAPGPADRAGLSGEGEAMLGGIMALAFTTMERDGCRR